MSRAVTVRRTENGSAWYVRHPITGVEFLERTVEKMKARVLWFYSSGSRFLIGNVYKWK